MKAHSIKDPQCTPNVITYSALMTACCAGGRPDKAHEAFLDMRSRGIQPDHISYSTLIAGEPCCLAAAVGAAERRICGMKPGFHVEEIQNSDWS